MKVRFDLKVRVECGSSESHLLRVPSGPGMGELRNASIIENSQTDR